MENCPSCMQPLEAASMGLDPCQCCRHNAYECSMRNECAALKMFDAKVKENEDNETNVH